MITLSQIDTFCTVVERGSFTQAAKLRGVTPGAISNHIHGLETRLQPPLFKRDGGAVKITPAGKTFAKHATEIMRHIAQIEMRIDALKQ
ncbi:DNA-binding transcriptional LysR family regulator [Pararhizobium capsulatum DSM 1112]|uniref:DNA-binding transcriptional LysR family regulator n=1 Tax=Pararhizobium capsulatum DSM 1112 TaxID=1121113 RepID=A0ABU0C3B0_9HYPH|nr:LysR family transcriptional regulator [Pararhizobium capsulatum]MDQ0323557.1 DNA-binding transcriptional LysR family regulator [Pararhizobium capsulatum DSM 1112]